VPRFSSEDKLGSESWTWLGGNEGAAAVVAAGRFTGAVRTVSAPPGARAEAAAGSGRVITVLAPGAGVASCARLGGPPAAGAAATGVAGVASCARLGGLPAAGAAATGVAGVAGTPPVRTDAALCSNWETLAGEEICCNTSKPGRPGLVGAAGSAAALGLSARTAEHRPVAPTAVMARRFLVRDIFLPTFFGVGTDAECIVLLA
jgi:hypothetical protein